MTQVGESVAVTTIPAPPEKEFEAEIISVKFADSTKAAHQNSQITGDHWPAPLYQGKYSQKPAVYAFGSTAGQNIEIKIKVTSKGYSGNGKLSGLGASLEFEAQVPLSSGQHTIVAKMIDPPKALSWVRGHISWGVELPDQSVLAGTTFVELFFVFKDPSTYAFFNSKGVWTEALRYLFVNGSFIGEDNEHDSVAKVTQLCFSIPYHKYDIMRGAPSFGGASGTFKLKAYMQPTNQNVNCYDQAYAVIVFSSALGCDVEGIFINPFGFLSSSDLVGYGRCNNPFPSNKYASAVAASPSATMKLEDFLHIGINDRDRSPFGNHMFCEFSLKIYDACAGPVKGGVNRAGYARTAIDSGTSLYSLYSGFNAGTVADMVSINSIGAAVRSVI